MPLLYVMLGGALGSGARFLVGRAALAWLGAGFPWGTLAVNVLGGFLMGALYSLTDRAGVAEGWRLFLGVGLLGGFTTFSAFSLDTVELMQRGAFSPALTYVAASVLGACLALWAGLAMGRIA